MIKTLSRIYTFLIFLFLYAPIFVLIVFSFNNSKSHSWKGFTFKWYEELFSNSTIMNSLLTSLTVAVIAAVVSTIIGTAAAIGIFSLKKRTRSVVMNVTYLPIINPEIVTGISFMLLYVMLFNKLNFLSIVLSHITFCIPYVIFSVLPKLRQMNPHLYEAAQDLGCKPFKAFFKAVLPEIMPGVFTGMLLAFTLSLDDFVISYFTSGSDAQPLPVTIFAMTRRQVSPQINALSSILFITVLMLLLIRNIDFKNIGGKSKKRSIVH